MKKCSKCGLTKGLVEFYRRRVGPRKGEYYEKCRDCYKIRGRSYYHLHRERQLTLALARRKRYKEERRTYINDLKRSKPCADCRQTYPPWVMDFDHREGEVKIASLSTMAITNSSNFEKIKTEIEKCDLVCANCHRQRTYTRLMKQKHARMAELVKASA